MISSLPDTKFRFMMACIKLHFTTCTNVKKAYPDQRATEVETSFYSDVAFP